MPKETAIMMQEQTGKALLAVHGLNVLDDASYEKATELLVNIKKVGKMVKGEKDKVLGPILEAEKAERNRWRPIELDITRAEETLKGKMLTFVNERERHARIEEAKIQAQLDAGKIKKPETAMKKLDAVEKAPETVQVDRGSSAVRKVKVVKIVEPEKVPDQYWVLDEVRIRREALAGVEIAGVVVELENQIAGSTR